MAWNASSGARCEGSGRLGRTGGRLCAGAGGFDEVAAVLKVPGAVAERGRGGMPSPLAPFAANVAVVVAIVVVAMVEEVCSPWVAGDAIAG